MYKMVMDKGYNGQCITISKNTMMVWQKRTWDLPSFGNKSRQQQGTIARKWRCNSRWKKKANASMYNIKTAGGVYPLHRRIKMGPYLITIRHIHPIFFFSLSLFFHLPPTTLLCIPNAFLFNHCSCRHCIASTCCSRRCSHYAWTCRRDQLLYVLATSRFRRSQHCSYRIQGRSLLYGLNS